MDITSAMPAIAFIIMVVAVIVIGVFQQGEGTHPTMHDALGDVREQVNRVGRDVRKVGDTVEAVKGVLTTAPRRRFRTKNSGTVPNGSV